MLHVLQPVGANCGCPGGQTILAAIKHGILYSVQADPMQALDVRTMTPLIMQPSMNANPIKQANSRFIIATSQVLTKTSKVTGRAPADAGSYDP